MAQTDPQHSERPRPRISVGSMIGFSTVGLSFLVGTASSMLWLGGLDRTVTDLKERVDKADRDNAAFTVEMRNVLKEASKSIADLSVEVARTESPNATHRRR